MFSLLVFAKPCCSPKLVECSFSSCATFSNGILFGSFESAVCAAVKAFSAATAALLECFVFVVCCLVCVVISLFKLLLCVAILLFNDFSSCVNSFSACVLICCSSSCPLVILELFSCIIVSCELCCFTIVSV